ncbi:MAG TPA: GNAT family N-acetyltransferase [Flavobacterium sp.]|jgi:ribosomal protein S18 acetylase RimI-like enzyme
MPDRNPNLRIGNATEADIPTIIEIAYATWPVAYGEILSAEQLDYMLRLFYSASSLQKNMLDGQRFLLVQANNTVVGFSAYEATPATRTTHINKIYVLPQFHGCGAGKKLMQEMEQQAISEGSHYITLNVNRSNPAQRFYNRLGFQIAKEVDIELEHGYLMEDYLMQKELR